MRRPFLAPGFPATQQERTAPAVLLAASLHAAPDLTQEAETTGTRAPADAYDGNDGNDGTESFT